MLYDRFIALTTVGSGDLPPMAPGARPLVVCQGLGGQPYPCITLARLVSREITRPRQKD